ncbi:hypothetical protein A0E43_07235 [Pectobacterium cacticida]
MMSPLQEGRVTVFRSHSGLRTQMLVAQYIFYVVVLMEKVFFITTMRRNWLTKMRVEQLKSAEYSLF